jgi:hypothetical protein
MHTHPRPLALTDAQLAQLQQATRTVPPSQRDEFLQGVARRLGSQPSDRALEVAIDAQLAVNRLPVFLCDHAAKGATNK